MTRAEQIAYANLQQIARDQARAADALDSIAASLATLAAGPTGRRKMTPAEIGAERRARDEEMV